MSISNYLILLANHFIVCIHRPILLHIYPYIYHVFGHQYFIYASLNKDNKCLFYNFRWLFCLLRRERKLDLICVSFVQIFQIQCLCQQYAFFLNFYRIWIAINDVFLMNSPQAMPLRQWRHREWKRMKLFQKGPKTRF